MFQLNNLTPFVSDIVVLADRNGVDSLVLMVKASFLIDSKWVLQDPQVNLQQADEYFGEPLFSSLKAASDYHLPKCSTDIFVSGSAISREGYLTQKMPVGIEVGMISKRVMVFGNRVWDGHQISSPEAFESMPIIYENAYGGQRVENNTILDSDVRNPVGRGYISSGRFERGDIFLPNIEDPNCLMQNPTDKPSPAGIGPIPPYWHPRVSYVGTYDEIWSTERAPFYPLDFDERFFSGASPGLIYPGYLSGGETVKVSGMHERGNLEFSLPEVRLRARAKYKNLDHDFQLNLETLSLSPNDARLSLTWKGIFCCGNDIQKVSDVTVSLTR